jgi:hypothetical protein
VCNRAGRLALHVTHRHPPPYPHYLPLLMGSGARTHVGTWVGAHAHEGTCTWGGHTHEGMTQTHEYTDRGDAGPGTDKGPGAYTGVIPHLTLNLGWASQEMAGIRRLSRALCHPGGVYSSDRKPKKAEVSLWSLRVHLKDPRSGPTHATHTAFAWILGNPQEPRGLCAASLGGRAVGALVLLGTDPR